jgi:hypothetical protein
MTLVPDDDLRHSHGPGRWWSESFYFNFFDSRSRMGGIIRIGFSPAWGMADGFLVLRLAEGALLIARLRVPWIEASAGEVVVAAGALTARCEEPMARWHVAYDGDAFVIADPGELAFYTASGLWILPRRRLRLALSFNAFHPPYLFPKLPQRWLPLREVLAPNSTEGSLSGRVKMLPALLKSAVAMRQDNRHFEQSGHWRGAIEIDAERFDFAGTGMRDRSWGTRDWRVFDRYRWINAQFGERLAFNAFRMRAVGHEAWGGFVWQDGRLSTLSDWSREEQDGGAATLTLRPETGKEVVVRAKTLTPVRLTLMDAGFKCILDEAVGHFVWAGEERLGVNEHVHRSYP